MAGFTARDNRAAMRRGCFVVGKNALILNEFPRPTGFENESFVLDFEVRTDFPEKVAFFHVGTGGRNFCGLFAG
ncbi:MAG: hypothetical protein U0637_05310 [Phycisphaerales bacterium]